MPGRLDGAKRLNRFDMVGSVCNHVIWWTQCFASALSLLRFLRCRRMLGRRLVFVLRQRGHTVYLWAWRAMICRDIVVINFHLKRNPCHPDVAILMSCGTFIHLFKTLLWNDCRREFLLYSCCWRWKLMLGGNQACFLKKCSAPQIRWQ